MLQQRFTVSAITRYIRQKLERDATLQNVWLEGEISNWKRATSGHIYFTLKDSGATIRCVVWRSQAIQLVYTPRMDGEAVLVHGRVSLYETGGNYQFYVDDIEPVGQGDLHTQFERLKAKLSAEGLFDSHLKQPLPAFPQKIGLVTSSTGAALQDILNVMRRRYTIAQLILSPTLVQGEQAPLQIIAALKAVIKQQVDVIILARGGGSLEDLWAFNDETLARAIVASPIPIVTGIGHEVDFTIADFVADVRAPTPSAAAELITPDKIELRRQISIQQVTLHEVAQRQIEQMRNELQNQTWLLNRLSPNNLINNHRQRIDDMSDRLSRNWQHHIIMHRSQLNNMTTQLNTLNPEAVLSRGYAIVQRESTLITHAHQVIPGDDLIIKLADGQLEVIVNFPTLAANPSSHGLGEQKWGT
jgi:exodeoxyribonuclease VII large subunit